MEEGEHKQPWRNAIKKTHKEAKEMWNQLSSNFPEGHNDDSLESVRK